MPKSDRALCWSTSRRSNFHPLANLLAIIWSLEASSALPGKTLEESLPPPEGISLVVRLFGGIGVVTYPVENFAGDLAAKFIKPAGYVRIPLVSNKFDDFRVRFPI
jgi:hypothetical protein